MQVTLCQQTPPILNPEGHWSCQAGLISIQSVGDVSRVLSATLRLDATKFNGFALTVQDRTLLLTVKLAESVANSMTSTQHYCDLSDTLQ